MRNVTPYPLWIGNAGDVRKPKSWLDQGIQAVIDLAGDEPVASIPRDLPYFRFPIVDGSENPDWLLRAAIRVVSEMLAADIVTLVACSAGMSRSPAIAAGALAMVSSQSPEDCLAICVAGDAADVSPGLWEQIRSLISAGASPSGHPRKITETP